MVRPRFALVLVISLMVAAAPTSAQDVDKSDNVTQVAHVQYTGGVELSFDGDLVIAGQRDGAFRNTVPDQGAIRVFDISEGVLQARGELDCHGNDNYVATVGPGLVAVAHHVSRRRMCNPRTTGHGMFLVDVSDPDAPRALGGVAVNSGHTLTPHPNGELVYVSPGGIANGTSDTEIVDVTDPLNPVVAAKFRSSRIGCHDIGFHPTEDLAYCAGLGEVQIWDIADPLAPAIVGTIVNPFIQFGHNAIVSPDGSKLVINDEAFVAHDCATGYSPVGSLWIYDLSIDPRVPVPAGRIAPPTGAGPVGGAGDPDVAMPWCTSHNYNFAIPDIVVSSWFTGGTTVHDISNPALPDLIAYYKPADARAYTAHWYSGHVFVSDSNRGIEMLKIDDPRLPAE